MDGMPFCLPSLVFADPLSRSLHRNFHIFPHVYIIISQKFEKIEPFRLVNRTNSTFLIRRYLFIEEKTITDAGYPTRRYDDSSGWGNGSR